MPIRAAHVLGCASWRGCSANRNAGYTCILLVTVLTSMNDSDVRATYKENSVRELIDKRVKRAMLLGCDGVIASGLEASRIKQAAARRNKPNFLVVTPG